MKASAREEVFHLRVICFAAVEKTIENSLQTRRNPLANKQGWYKTKVSNADLQSIGVIGVFTANRAYDPNHSPDQYTYVLTDQVARLG